jgi:hypothetical protein
VTAAIELLAAVNPDAVALARLASLAAQVEPELLRALRLALVPAADVSAEADLWWSDLVEARAATAIRLDPGAQAALRAELTSTPDALAAAAAITAAVHVDAPPLARVQERLVVAALTGDAATCDDLLRQVLGSLLAATGADRARLAAWAIGALPRLPIAAHGGPFWSLLYAATADGRGAARVDAAPTAAMLADAWASIPDVVAAAPRARLEAALRGGALWLRIGDGDIEVPDLPPIVVAIDAGDGHAIARVSRDAWTRVEVAGPPIRVTTIDRRVYTLAPAAPVADVDWRAIAGVHVAGTLRGTGYLVGPTHVVTADIIAPDDTVDVEIDDRTYRARRRSAIPEGVLLELDHAVAGVAPLALATEPLRDGPVQAYAVPGAVLTAAYTSQPAPEVRFDEPAQIEARAMGAPILVQGQVAGHLHVRTDRTTVCSAAAVQAMLDRARSAHDASRLAPALGRGVFADDAVHEIARRLTGRGLFALVGGTAAARRRLLHGWLATVTADERVLAWSFLGTGETRARHFATACARHFEVPAPATPEVEDFAAIAAAIVARDGTVVLDGPERVADHDRPALDAFTRAFAMSPRGRCVLATPERRDKATTLIPIGSLPRREVLRHALAVGLYPAQPDDLGIDVTVNSAMNAALEAAVQREGSRGYSDVRAALGAAARWLQAPDDPSLDSELFGAADASRRHARDRSHAFEIAAIVAEAAARRSHQLASKAIEEAIALAGDPSVMRALRRELLGDFVEEVWYLRSREPARRVQPGLVSLLSSPSRAQLRVEVVPEIGPFISIVRAAPGEMRRVLDRWRAGDAALEALIEWLAEDAPAERPDDPHKGRFGALPERNRPPVSATSRSCRGCRRASRPAADYFFDGLGGGIASLVSDVASASATAISAALSSANCRSRGRSFLPISALIVAEPSPAKPIFRSGMVSLNMRRESRTTSLSSPGLLSTGSVSSPSSVTSTLTRKAPLIFFFDRYFLKPAGSTLGSGAPVRAATSCGWLASAFSTCACTASTISVRLCAGTPSAADTSASWK